MNLKIRFKSLYLFIINNKFYLLIHKYYSESISRSINRQTNADFFAELIGVISNIRQIILILYYCNKNNYYINIYIYYIYRFASVSDKFKSELTKAVNVMKESKVELLIHSMRFLKLKVIIDIIYFNFFFFLIFAIFYQ